MLGKAAHGLAAVPIGIGALPAFAQTNGSSGLAEIYSNMPADQRQAVLRQAGGGQGGKASVAGQNQAWFRAPLR